MSTLNIHKLRVSKMGLKNVSMVGAVPPDADDADFLQRALDRIVRERSSVRAFTGQAVSDQQVEEILRVASRAPSGVNAQPWRVYVLRGPARKDLVQKVCAAHDALFREEIPASEYTGQYPYYPSKWFDPYLQRRRQNGYALYQVLGIAKGEKDRMHRQHQNNFRFFGAPVGIMFTMHRDLGQGALLDYGAFLQNVMLAAKARGLDTCPQAAWNTYAKIILPLIGAGPDEILVCGMSLGYRDDTHAVNMLRTPREEPGSFVTFV
ncbi:MAG TPA: nitroreductase [Candidimonas sp.]|nr:nitroreductase [Candidimonas sp.]